MYTITIAAPGATTTHAVERQLSIGREGTDIVIAHAGVSRSHATIAPGDGYCVVTDLASSNGTYINDARIDVPTMARPGDVVRFGTEVTLTVQTTEPVRPQAATAPSPAPDVETIDRDSIEVRWIPRSAGRRAAKSMLDKARRARRKLAGFGNEADGHTVVIHLIDPLERNGELVTSGTIVDADTNQMWCIVSAESRPEDPTRAMALIFGGVFPAAERLEPLIAGYGLHLIGEHDAPARSWNDLDEPDRTRTAAAFIHHLVEHSDDESVRAFLASPPESIQSNARKIFGKSTDQLVRAWMSADDSDHKPGEFVRLAFRRLWPYKFRQAEVFVYMILSLAFTSVYPFVTRHLFDEVIPSRDFSRVWQLLLLLVAAFAVSLLASVRRSYQSSFISSAVVRDLRQEMFDRSQRLSTQALDGYQQGEVMSRMFQDVGQLQSGLSAMINTGIFQFVSLLVSGAIMLSVNLWLGLLVCGGAPIIAIAYRQMGAGAQKRSLAVQEDGAELMSVAAENYRAGPVVKLFRLEGRESARFARAGDKVIASTQRLSLFSGLFGLSVNFVMTLLQMTVLGVGAWMIFEDQFTLGGLVAFLGVMSEFLNPVTKLTTLGQTMQQSMGSLKRVEEVTNAATEPAGEDLPELVALSHQIELRNLSFSYTADRRTLDGLNVTIPAGSRVAFVGPSGSGKSTVLQALMRLIEPDEGAILVDGVDLRERALSSWRRQIGVVFQDPFLFDISLADNIALGGDEPTAEQIAAAADAAEIDSFLAQLPEGLNSPVGEGGSMLSGGQRQRAAIARALVGNPNVLILDEATSALDAATERAINDTIDRAGSGRTVISVTHRLTAITDYDLIVVLVDGRVESQGTHDALLAEAGTYARLWSEQTGTPMPSLAQGRAVDVVDSLASLAVLRTAARSALEALAASGTATRRDTGALVTPPAGGLAVILAGRADLATAAGEIHEVGPGDVVGGTALLTGDDASATIAAREPLELLMLEAEPLNPFVIAHRSAATSTDVPEHAKTLVRATMTTQSPPGAYPTRAVLHAGAARSTLAMAAPARPGPDVRATVATARLGGRPDERIEPTT